MPVTLSPHGFAALGAPREPRSGLAIERVYGGHKLDAADGLLRQYMRQIGTRLSAAPSAPASLNHSGWRAASGRLRLAYIPPQGALLIAWQDGEPAGCVALRAAPNSVGVGEVQRLFVAERFRSRGIALALMREIGQAARRLGYRQLLMELDDQMSTARRICLAWGFAPISPRPTTAALPGHQTLALNLA